MQTGNDIRTAFLDYFARHGHTVVPSSPLVPRNDPSLMFTNSGMVQFKNLFTGVEKRAYRRAATSQKCVRAGGKHNDLQNVGYTARHHTFFEMLGNFSFGDYFKDVAIELAWDLVTKEFGLEPERMLVTVYSEDDVAADLWRRIAGLPDEKIIRVPTSDNFWAMGDTGPCGPCSEIFYDHGPALPGGPPGSAAEDGDRFIEIWNLVFMQFEQVTPAERIDLPQPSIDTGMGLERITAVLQGQHDNYATDLLRPLMLASADATDTAVDGPQQASHKVIADHLRATSFLIADGVLPSNEGRGYVLRRIMRRAMRHAHLLGAEEPLLWRLVPTLTGLMGQPFPELLRAEALITETLKLEEGRFKDTLGRGLRLLAEATDGLAPGAALAGEVAFRLYDTYGFPLDLTQDILRGQGRAVEAAGFEAAMARQRAAARRAWAGSGERATDEVWYRIREASGATEFLGYETELAEGRIEAIVVAGRQVDHAETGTDVAIVLNQTPFYAEAGGQVGDTGTITGPRALRVAITDTEKRLGDLHVHIGRLESGRLAVGDEVVLAIDGARRAGLRANHSATHLLHAALRRTLGEHVTQKGSLVAPERLRFDISHPKPLGAAELAIVEDAVNRQIRADRAVTTGLMTPADAIAAGALALFGEKYDDEVRVLSMGEDEDGAPYSVELCGGTHVGRTGELGLFKIVEESAVGAGVRRIEALTGAAALAHLNAQDARVRETAAALKVAPADLRARVAALVAERRRLERALSEARRQLAAGGGGAGAPAAKDVAGILYDPHKLEDVPARELKSMADEFKRRLGSGVVAVTSVTDGKASLVVGVTDDLTDRLDAVALVRVGSAALGGKGGGGRPDMAQAGGPDASKVDAALAEIEREINDRGSA